MKKIQLLCVISVAILIFACEKKTLITYDNESAGNSIYFPTALKANSLRFSFGYKKESIKDSIIKILVRKIGSPKSLNENYLLSIAAGTTMVEGVDYEILNQPLSIKAGKVADTLQIKFHRTVKLKTDSMFLNLELMPNENFSNKLYSLDTVSFNKPFTKYYTRLKITLDDIPNSPSFWTIGEDSRAATTINYLGTFSEKKFKLLISLLNLDVEEILEPEWLSQPGNVTRLGAWALSLKNYLSRMRLSGTPIYEKDGVTLMTVGLGI